MMTAVSTWRSRWGARRKSARCRDAVILATQRPSVDVEWRDQGQLPVRIAPAERPQDSKTIIGRTGAERLLGNGDMLGAPNPRPEPQPRAHLSRRMSR